MAIQRIVRGRARMTSPLKLKRNIKVTKSATIVTGVNTCRNFSLNQASPLTAMIHFRETLANLANATGSMERLSIPDIWNDLPKQKQYINRSHFLALAAMVLLLIEVFERRTGLVSAIRLRVPRAWRRKAAEQTTLDEDQPEIAKNAKRKITLGPKETTKIAEKPPQKPRPGRKNSPKRKADSWTP